MPGRAVAPLTPRHLPIKFPSALTLLRGKPQLRNLFWLLGYTVLLWLIAFPSVLPGNLTGSSSHPVTNPQVTQQIEFYSGLLLLFGLPLWSLMAGACFGSWRGIGVTLLGLGGGFLLADVFNHFLPALLHGEVQFASMPVAALITGVVAERRRFYGWLKACWMLLPGTLLIVINFDLTSRDPANIKGIAELAIYFVILLLFAASLEIILQNQAERLQKRHPKIPPQP